MHIMRINLTLRYFDSLSSHRLRGRSNERAVTDRHKVSNHKTTSSQILKICKSALLLQTQLISNFCIY